VRVVAEPLPAVWGVGRLVIADEVVPWPVSAADIDDEALVAAEHLSVLGVGEADVVIIVSLLSDAIHTYPLEQAAGLRKAVYSCTDATPFDAFRTAALTRQLAPKAVVGLSPAVLEGLTEQGRDLTEIFGAVPAVATSSEEAYRVLKDAGLAARRWLRIGPTSAFECEALDGAHYDGTRWRVETDHDGHVLVTNLAPRLTAADRLMTGLVGEVAEDRCACGRRSPRVRVRA
jgi:hypothetical protein